MTLQRRIFVLKRKPLTVFVLVLAISLLTPFIQNANADDSSRAEAQRRMSRGEAAVEMAGDPAGFLRAADEFRAAIAADPDLAAAYYQLGKVLDQAGHYDEAMESLQTYLEKAPGAPDADAVQQLIYKIEFRKENAAEQAREAEAAAAEQAKMDISGIWIPEGKDPYDAWQPQYRITKVGNEYQMRIFSPQGNFTPPNTTYYLTVDQFVISGRVSWDASHYSNGGVWEYDVDGSVEADGNTLRVHHLIKGPTGVTGNYVEGWREWEHEQTLVRIG
jgi:tetratricopeptide (TPR) repeat protein